MTQIHFRPITLDELVDKARYILVVERDEPWRTEELVPVRSGNDSFAPYPHVWTHYVVVEALKGDGAIPAGDRLRVAEAHHALLYAAHKRLATGGPARSPIVTRYASPVAPEAGRSIVFLCGDAEHLAFCAVDAIETPARRADILAASRRD